MTGNFFQGDRFFKLDLTFLCGSNDAVCNRMCGVLFTACTHGKEFIFRVFTGGNNLLKLEVTLCDSTGLIHDHSAELT